MIPYGKQFIDSKDINSVVKALKQSKITQGKIIDKFENDVKKFLKVKYAVAVSSASAGLHIAVKAIPHLKKSDTAITSPISFVSTANAVLHSSLKLQFSDIDRSSLNLDIDKLKIKVKKSHPKLVIPVHLSGVSFGEEELKRLSKKKKFFIIEDAAHSFGAKYNDGTLIGNCKYSDMTVFSFHPVKTITTGEGGVVTTNSRQLYNRLIELRNHGIKRGKSHFQYDVKSLSFNYRITDFQCALGISQLKKIKKIISKRKQISIFYDKKFKEVNNIFLPQTHLRKLSSNHLYILNINFNKLKISRKELIKKLLKKGIVTQIHYIPIPLHSYYKKKGYNMKNLVKAKQYFEEALSIPIFYTLSLQKQKSVSKLIIKVINDNKKN